MKRTIVLKVKPFSINAMTGRDVRHKSAAYSNWHYQVQQLLKAPKIAESLKDLREFFDESIHSYSVCLTSYYPPEILFTRESKMSAKAHDLSNIEKPLIDILFLPVHHKDAANLNIDDKFISDLSSKKRPLQDYCIEVVFEVLNVDNIMPDLA